MMTDTTETVTFGGETARSDRFWARALRLAAVCWLTAWLAACSLPASRPPPPFLGLPTTAPPPTLAPIEPRPVAEEYLTHVQFLTYDPFNNLRNWNIHDNAAQLAGGMLELQGAPGWQGSFWAKGHFTEGEGLAIRFKVQKANALSEFVFVTGEWKTDSFRQFGVYNATVPKGDLFMGTADLGGYNLISNLALLSDTWYDLLLAVGRHGHFLAVVWDPIDPSRRAFYDIQGGPSWAGKSWIFLPKANQGETVYVDDFYRISFGDIK